MSGDRIVCWTSIQSGQEFDGADLMMEWRELNSPGKKILCTLGPASLDDHTLTRLEELNVSLLRINLSHTRLDDVGDLISFIQERTSVPICLDTEGAQIRTGNVLNGELFLRENGTVNILGAMDTGDPGDLNFYPAGAVNLLEPGDFLSIDFNSVLAQVTEKESDRLELRILTGGRVGSNKAVSVLNREVELPVLTEKDRHALVIGAESGIRHVALSFANRGSDVDELMTFIAKNSFIISKIESVTGLGNLEAIAARSDALLLDRGDLSRQVSVERIPMLQKEIIRRAKKAGVQIFVATNLLESMVTEASPTRAEVSDVFNTLCDGADGLVLAAETAIGSFPVSCAMMVSKIIEAYSRSSTETPEEYLHQKEYFLLTEPHGGQLVNRVDDRPDMDRIAAYPPLPVARTVLLDAEQIAVGAFSPLEGFMTKIELDSVLGDYRLPDGVVWPMPVVLQVSRDEADRLHEGDTVSLVSEDTGEVHATLHLEEIYTFDLDDMCARMFGSSDDRHPGVRQIRNGGQYFLGGKIRLIRRLPSEHKKYELTPAEVRAIFENKGWSKIVGFHTRNVIHRAHEHIQMHALQEFHCDGLFVHPIIGPKKKGDYTAEIILKSYELMSERFFPEKRVLLGAFHYYPRYSGPREAVFTALCRKNFGCSHFIIGRDHTGVESNYRERDPKEIFSRLGDIGITPILYREVNYCRQCERHVVDSCEHDQQQIMSIKGTEGRKMLESGAQPPGWFMREEISRLIMDEMEGGSDIFV